MLQTERNELDRSRKAVFSELFLINSLTHVKIPLIIRNHHYDKTSL